MIRTQIYLTEAERRGVARLAQRSGKKQSEVIRGAIDQLLRANGVTDRLARVRKARGIWKGRKLPELAELRREFDRY